MFAVLVVVFGFPEVAQPPRIGFHLQNSRKQYLIFTAFVRNVCCFSIRWNNDLLCTEQSAIRTAKVPHAIVVYRRRTRGVITKVSFVNLRLPCRGERKRLIAFAHGLQSCRFARSFSALGPWQNIRVRVPKARTLRNWMRISFGCSGAQKTLRVKEVGKGSAMVFFLSIDLLQCLMTMGRSMRWHAAGGGR